MLSYQIDGRGKCNDNRVRCREACFVGRHDYRKEKDFNWRIVLPPLVLISIAWTRLRVDSRGRS